MTADGRLQMAFSLRGISAPALLGGREWDGHLSLLQASYPQWAFDTSETGAAEPG
jgi:hypothetical protein